MPFLREVAITQPKMVHLQPTVTYVAMPKKLLPYPVISYINTSGSILHQISVETSHKYMQATILIQGYPPPPHNILYFIILVFFSSNSILHNEKAHDNYPNSY